MPSTNVRQVGSNGWPSPAEEELTDNISFDTWLGINRASQVMTKVPTDNLREEGIVKGDTVIVDRAKHPGKESVVVIQSSAGLQVDQLKNIPQDNDSKLIGVVVTVIRKY